MQSMEALLTYSGVRASRCDASGSHSPVPLRYVWHHIQPHECGGATAPENLVQVCDTCHYSIHRILYNLARGYIAEANGQGPVPVGLIPRQLQLVLAQRGLAACIAAGTVTQIPNEG